MVMAFLADLNEKEPTTEMVHHFLPATAVPPFNGVVVLPTGRDDPIWRGLAQDLLRLGGPGLFFFGEVNVAFEIGRANTQTQIVVQEFDKAMDEMVGGVVAALDQWIMADHRADLRVVLVQRCKVRVVFPKRRA